MRLNIFPGKTPLSPTLPRKRREVIDFYSFENTGLSLVPLVGEGTNSGVFAPVSGAKIVSVQPPHLVSWQMGC
jgi:hypothetical protein